MQIARDFEYGDYDELDNPEVKAYIKQVVEMLGLVHAATKIFEGEDLPSIALVIPTILSVLLHLEVSKMCFQIEYIV